MLPLFVGMPIFITDNIATELGLTNGTRGVIKSIHFKRNEVMSNDSSGVHHLKYMPDFVIAELEDITMKPLEGLKQNCVPIFPKKGSFVIHVPAKKGKKRPSITINRIHFPIVPRYGCTSHKSQGMTLSDAIIDLVVPEGKKGGVEINFSYVPLSRVRQLKDLTILRPFDSSVLKAKVNKDCKAMMECFKTKDICKGM